MKNLRIFLILVIVSCLLRPSMMVSNRLGRGYARRTAATLPLSPGHFSLPMSSPTLFAPCPTGSAPCVQSVTGYNISPSTGATKDLTLPGSQTAGNMNYVTLRACLDGGCSVDPTTTSCAATDDNGNPYTLIRNQTFNGSFLLCTFYAPNIAPGVNTVHLSVSGGVSGGVYDYVGGEVTEVSGVVTALPLDIDGFNFGTGTAVTTSTTGPTTHADDLLIAGAWSRFNTRTVAAPYGYVDNSSQFTAFTVVSGTGTQSISMTASNSDAWAVSLAAFKCLITGCGGGGGGLTPAQKARPFFGLLPF